VPDRWGVTLELLRLADPGIVAPGSCQCCTARGDSRDPHEVSRDLRGAAGVRAAAPQRHPCVSAPCRPADGRQRPGRRARPPEMAAGNPPRDGAHRGPAATRLHRSGIGSAVGRGHQRVPLRRRQVVPRRHPRPARPHPRGLVDGRTPEHRSGRRRPGHGPRATRTIRRAAPSRRPRLPIHLGRVLQPAR
jgi:hypothetical protein